MRLAALAAGLFLGAGALAAGQDEGFRTQFEAGTSASMGGAFEYVLRDGTYTNPKSRLSWPIPPSVGIEFRARFPWTGWTATTASLEAAWPVASGTLIDEDWNVQTKSGLLIYGRSEHDLWVTTQWKATLEQSLQWESYSLSVGGLFRQTVWEGWNGSGSYTYSGGTTTNPYTGLVLEYRQIWLIPYLGASARWEGDAWALTPSVRFSPFTFCSDTDHHNYAGNATWIFLDYPLGGWYAQSSVEASFPGGPGWGWGLRVSGELTWGAVGTTIETFSLASVGTYNAYANGAGAWFREASLTFFVRN